MTGSNSVMGDASWNCSRTLFTIVGLNTAVSPSLLRVGMATERSRHIRQVIAADRSVWVRIVEIVNRAPEEQAVTIAELVIDT